jgi:hypothetical protein
VKESKFKQPLSFLNSLKQPFVQKKKVIYSEASDPLLSPQSPPPLLPNAIITEIDEVRETVASKSYDQNQNVNFPSNPRVKNETEGVHVESLLVPDLVNIRAEII